MKRVLIILLIGVMAVVFYVWTLRTGPKPAPAGTQLAPALKIAEATNQETILVAWTQLPNNAQSEKEQISELEDLAKTLLPNGAWRSLRDKQGYILEGTAEDMEIQLSLKASASHQSNYLFARLSLANSALLPEVETQWQEVFKSKGYQAHHSTLVTGTINGSLSYTEQEKIMKNIFQLLAVQEPWEMRDGELVTWGGRTPRIPGFLRDIQGEPINIQVALRYHYLEDRTYLYLGSPLIFSEY